MQGSSIETVEAFIGFSKRDQEPEATDDIFVPGYPDNRITPRRRRIEDARNAATPSLDREGFSLVEHRTAFAEERDRSVLTKDYNDEMADFIKEYTNASVVVPSRTGLLVRYGDRLVGRRRHEGRDDIIDDRIPASFAHIDYLSDFVIDQVAVEAKVDGFPDITFSRMIVMQTWRAVSDPPQDVPLAICDRRTLDRTDISPRKGVLSPENSGKLPDPVFYVGGIHFNPKQRWCYYPSMRKDEVLLFTGYDTANPDHGMVAHAAFDNRAHHSNAHPRESFEARFYVYYQ